MDCLHVSFVGYLRVEQSRCVRLCIGELSADVSHSVVREGAIPVSFGGTASGLLQALDDVSDAALDAFAHKPLDNAGLPDYCDEACLEKSVWVRDGSHARWAGSIVCFPDTGRELEAPL